MKTHTIERDFVSFGNVYASDLPDKAVLTFDTTQFRRLKKLIKLAAKEKIDIRVEHNDFELFTDGELNEDWRNGYSYVLIYPSGSMYFNTQHKHDASAICESDGFTLEDLITEYEPAKTTMTEV